MSMPWELPPPPRRQAASPGPGGYGQPPPGYADGRFSVPQPGDERRQEVRWAAPPPPPPAYASNVGRPTPGALPVPPPPPAWGAQNAAAYGQPPQSAYAANWSDAQQRPPSPPPPAYYTRNSQPPPPLPPQQHVASYGGMSPSPYNGGRAPPVSSPVEALPTPLRVAEDEEWEVPPPLPSASRPDKSWLAKGLDSVLQQKRRRILYLNRLRQSELGARSRGEGSSWRTSCCAVPCSAPGAFCQSLLCAPCVAYSTRRRVMGGSVESYRCCENSFCLTACDLCRAVNPCCVCEGSCPSCMLCLEASLCLPLSVCATRTFVQDDLDLSNGLLDEGLESCQVALLNAGLMLCQCTQVPHMLGEEGGPDQPLGSAACCASCCVALSLPAYLLCCVCMQAQHLAELNAAERGLDSLPGSPMTEPPPAQAMGGGFFAPTPSPLRGTALLAEAELPPPPSPAILALAAKLGVTPSQLQAMQAQAAALLRDAAGAPLQGGRSPPPPPLPAQPPYMPPAAPPPPPPPPPPSSSLSSSCASDSASVVDEESDIPDWAMALPPELRVLCVSAMETDPDQLDSLGMGGVTLFSGPAQIVDGAGAVTLVVRPSELAAWTVGGPGTPARMAWTLPLKRLQGAWWSEDDADVLLYDTEETADVHLRLGGGGWARSSLLGCLVAELGSADWVMEVEDTDEDPRGGPGGGRQVFFAPPPSLSP